MPVDEVLVADASRRTTSLNAYVSGFGGTRRVVVYDTLVESLPQDQALTVVAHELAHARHGDVVVGTALGALGAAAGVGLLGLLIGSRLNRGGARAGEAAVVPFVLAALAVGTVLSSPVQAGISRQIETRADVDALVATRRPGRVRRDAAHAGAAVDRGSHATGVVTVVVGESSDGAGAGGAGGSVRAADGQRPAITGAKRAATWVPKVATRPDDRRRRSSCT